MDSWEARSSPRLRLRSTECAVEPDAILQVVARWWLPRFHASLHDMQRWMGKLTGAAGSCRGGVYRYHSVLRTPVCACVRLREPACAPARETYCVEESTLHSQRERLKVKGMAGRVLWVSDALSGALCVPHGGSQTGLSPTGCLPKYMYSDLQGLRSTFAILAWQRQTLPWYGAHATGTCPSCLQRPLLVPARPC